MFTYAGMCGDLTYAYGLFLPSMAETYQWSRSLLSGPYAAFIIVGGLLGPVAGMTIARFGARLNIMLSNILAAAGLLGMSQADSIWHVYFFFGLMGGIGIAFGEFIPVTTIINHWFVSKRSLAMGLLFASGGLGGLIMPPVISWIIITAGWRTAWVFLAGIHLVLSVLMCAVLVKNKPEDMGLTPEGYSREQAHGGQSGPSHRPVYQTTVDWEIGAALRTGVLWIIMGLFSMVIFVMNLLTTHQVAYLQDIGFSPMASSAALGLMLGMSIIGRLLCGILGVRYEGRYLAMFFLTAIGLGVIALMNAVDIVFVYAYSILTGIGFGGMVVLIPNLLGAYFGRLHYPKIVGWMAPAVTLLSSFSPILAGVLFDITGTYFFPLAITAVLLFLCASAAHFARPPLHTVNVK